MERDKMFRKILEKYQGEDSKEEQRRGNVLKDTSKGYFVPSNMKKVYDFFNMVKLEKYKSFVDLGSGDGRVVLIASLFTKSAGIESDEELYEKSRRMKKKLGLDAELKKGDYMDLDISKYGAVYMYPDKEFTNAINDKLKKELKGDFL
ncbi:MAG: hypothetical protein NT001_03075, partial [Candidatus Woesearchaeota archaeon]|nr:hypothetical protein [Candidatus Woesearchaeota archaeon]